MCGSGSTKLLNTDPIRIRIHNTAFYFYLLRVCSVREGVPGAEGEGPGPGHALRHEGPQEGQHCPKEENHRAHQNRETGPEHHVITMLIHSRCALLFTV